MKNLIKTTAILAATSALTACGGSSNDGPVEESRPSSNSGSDFRPTARTTSTVSTVSTRGHFETSEGDATITMYCTEDRCRGSNGQFSWNINDPDHKPISSSVSPVTGGGDHGITLEKGTVKSSLGSYTTEREAYGYWGDEGFFSVSTNIRSPGSLGDVDIYGGRTASAGGKLSGSAPEFSATYRGLMVGTPAAYDQQLVGDAEITYTASDNQVDADFTRIRDSETGRYHSVREVNFRDVAVNSVGRYEKGYGSNRIQGGFGGSNHESTAGVFEKSGIIGAYGARKYDLADDPQIGELDTQQEK